jgi:membrane protease YdiL (CAAX protease family)
MYLAPVAGMATVLLVGSIDFAFFQGVTFRRLPEIGVHPPIRSRLLVAVLGGVLEEALFRVFLATLIASLSYAVLSLLVTKPKLQAEWVGTISAAVITALWWHLGSSEDLVRVLTVNLVVGLVYGWLYWSKGLEAAVMTHTVVYLCLYIAVPALR